jgi:hypothetical protein
MQGTKTLFGISLLLSLIIGGMLLKPKQIKEEPIQTTVAESNQTTYTAPYVSETGVEHAIDIQCPIPMKDRVKNGTGIQCVWSSIEMIGRWAEEPKLMNPPLTSRRECKSYSGAESAAYQLKKLGVKFEQSYSGKEKGLILLKKAMAEGRGCLWGVPGHAMVLVHYDEAANEVKWVDNSDMSLKIQTTTIPKFMNRWTGWILVVYADKDIIAEKLGRFPKIPFNSNEFDEDFVPVPRR